MSVSPYNMIKRTIATAEKRLAKTKERHAAEIALQEGELATLHQAEAAMRPATPLLEQPPAEVAAPTEEAAPAGEADA